MGLLPYDWQLLLLHWWDKKNALKCVYYLEAHQGGHSSGGLVETIDSLRAAGMEGVPARECFMASAHPYPVPLTVEDLQNAGLYPTGTALPRVAACTPKHTNKPNLPISPTDTKMSTSVGRKRIFLSLSFLTT